MDINEIKKRQRVVCICKGIKQGKIQDAINKGCVTLEQITKATGSGTGGCNATRCTPVILELLNNQEKKK